MSEGKQQVYKFGPFRLLKDKRRLFRESQVVPLQPKTFDLLLLLVERVDQVVSKDEIMAHVWADRIVEENNLSQHIYNLRRFLRDSEPAGNYIVTVPGGYVFTANVIGADDEEQIEDFGTTTESIQSSPVTEPVSRKTAKNYLHTTNERRLLILTIVLLCAFGITLRLYFNRNQVALVDHHKSRTKTFVSMKGIETFPAFSPDGRQVLFTSNGGDSDNGDLFVKNFGDGDAVRLTSNPRSEICATWSPDGQQIAFLRESPNSRQKYQLMIIPATGGEERELGQVWHGLDWSPDGKTLAVSDNQEPGMPTVIYLLSASGTERRAVTPEIAGQNIFENKARFSPDGRSIAFVRWNTDQTSDIFTVELDNGKIRQLTFDNKSVQDIEWTPDGRKLLFVSNRGGSHSLWKIGLDGGDPTLFDLPDTEIESFSISPDGKSILYTLKMVDSAIEVSNLDKRSISPISTSNENKADLPCRIDSSRQDDSPRFSPDGQRIAFTSNRTSWNELWVANSDCSNQLQVTRFEKPGEVGSPRWSPDGTSITFDRYADGEVDIFSIKSDGTKLRRLTDSRSLDIMPAWSRDGSWIFFNSKIAGVSNIWKIPCNGGPAVAVTRHGAWEAIESVDGKTLFFTKSDYLWQVDPRTGEESQIAELGEFAVDRNWDVTERNLYFIPKKFSGTVRAYRFDFQSREVHQISEVRGIIPRSLPVLTVSPDETRIAISSFSYQSGDIIQMSIGQMSIGE